jgi:hypothetical protein
MTYQRRWTSGSGTDLRCWEQRVPSVDGQTDLERIRLAGNRGYPPSMEWLIWSGHDITGDGGDDRRI